MRTGTEVRVPIPFRAIDLMEWLQSMARPFPNAETYIREEGGKAILYLVKHDGSGSGVIVGSRPLPHLPEQEEV